MRPWAAGAAILVAAALFLHHEVLLGGRVYHMDDAADGYYPSHVVARRALLQGELPTWERGSWCGWPQLADPYYGFYYPPTAVFYVLGAVRGLGLAIFAHVVLAALGMLWLCRLRGLDPASALLAAAALAFSSFMVVRIRHIIFPELMAWIPLLLAAMEGWLTTARRWNLVLAAVAMAMAVLCGALPLLPYLFLVTAAYVLPRIARDRVPRSRWAALGLAVIVAALVSMAQVVPTLAHLPLSPRALGVDYAFASTYAWPGPRYALTLLAPDVWGTEDRTRWYGAYNHWEMAGYYSGALVVLLAPLGLLRRGRPERWPLLAVAALGIGLAFGDRGPFHAWFFHHVPLYSGLRCPTRALVMTMVAVAILGADGLFWLSQRMLSAGWRVPLLLLAVAVAATVALAWEALAPMAAGGPAAAQAARALRELALILGAGAATMVLSLGAWMPWPLGRAIVAGLTLTELVLLGRGYIQPRPADWAEGTERFAAVDWLLDQRPAERFAPDPRGPFRLHNLGMTYGPPLEGASGYDSFGIWRYVNFLWAINTGAPYPHAALRDDVAAGDIERFDSPWVDFLGVRWAIAPAPPAPHWIERFHPAPGAAPHARHEPQWDPLLNVYENPRALPRAFIVYRAAVLGDDDAQLRAVVGSDPRAVAILDRAPAVEPLGRERPPTPARIVEVARHLLVVDAQADAPGILVASEPAYPGWTALVDGRPAPLLRADYAFRGVALGPGRHRVEMRFRSRPAEVGLVLTGLGCLGLMALGRLFRGPGAAS